MSDQAKAHVQTRSADAEAIQNGANKLFGDKMPDVAAKVSVQVVKAFSQFDPDDSERLDKFLISLTTEGKHDIKKAIAHCQNAIYYGESPLLVKSALAVFLTHSKEAHRLGIVVPSLKHYSEFMHVEGIPLSNPASPETIQGYGILSYWREDYDLNDHHNHWHIVYPHSGVGYPKHRTIDRQGELFLYMHSQMLARYNAELLSWSLDAVPAFQYDNLLTDGYTPPPNLTLQYIPRPANQGWDEPTKADQMKFRDNIFAAIHQGYFVTKKEDETSSKGKLILTSENAMNWVGIVVEAENKKLQKVAPGEFIDTDLYGSLHNNGHDYFSKIGHKPDGHYGVMSSVITAVRDPVFFFWHRHIDEFRRIIVKKYTHSINEFMPDAELEMVKIIPQESPQEEDSSGYTHIKTIMGHPQLELNEVNAKVDHEAYQWKIEVKSTKQPVPSKAHPQKVTVRLFIVPEGQQEDPHAWIEMDKFTQTLTKQSTSITRRDIESTVARKLDGSKWCKCGWPQNMMLPIGKTEGMPFIAFAMLTESYLSEPTVSDAISFCGAEASADAKDEPAKYPDALGMGYPFDKTWTELLPSETLPREMMPSIMSIVKSRRYMLTSKFKIYRTMKDYKPPSK